MVLCAPASASGTTYTCTPSPALGSYAAGTTLAFIPDVAGTAGAITVNVSALGAKSITIGDTGNTNPVGSTFVAGSVYLLTYDGTRFRYSPAQFDPSKSGSIYMSGLTSGGVALSVGDIAGTAITYVEPTTNGAADQVLFDSGVTTCPTLPTGFPAVCHLKVWTSVTNCGDATHALAYSTSSHVFSCQAITATGTPGGSNTQIQYNNSGALGGAADFTYVTHTLAGGASAVFDMSGAAHTQPALKGTIAGKPATCTQGEVYFATDATAGQNWFFCTATNTWTQQLNSGGGTGFVACHAYTYTSGTLTVDFSTYSCAIVTASGANPTLAFTAPTSSIATPLTLGLCNDGTARTWTLPGTAKRITSPVDVSACMWNEPIVFDGTNYQGPGSDTPSASFLGYTAERASFTCNWLGGCTYTNSTSHNNHFLNSSQVDFGYFKSGADCNPDTGICLKTNGTSFAALATTIPGSNVATFLSTPSGANFNLMIQAGGIPIAQGSHSAAYTTVLADGGTQVLHPTADNNARTFTIDSNANVAYPIGTTITFVNQINTLTIAITADTMYLGGTATTGSRTLAAHGYATALKTGTTEWIISGPGLN